MKQMRNRLTALLLAGCLLALCCLTACGNQNSGDADVSPSGSAPAETDGETVTITDMAGRTVTFPKNPEKVFSASPASEAWLCALVPERMIGWANTMTDEQLAYYPEEVSDIPLVGGWYGYAEGNAEGIITMAPDVVIQAEYLIDEENIAAAVQSCDELEQKLGTPVICVNYDLKEIPEVMRLLGQWLGVEERGNELADYLQGELDKVSESIAAVPAEEVVSYYYAEDASGLMTESADSFHSAVFIYCGLECVTDVSMSSFMGKEQVSMEQVINWDPEYIFAFSQAAYDTIRSDEAWSGIQAVEDGNVYLCPSAPQNWYDRSPNPLRVLGCLYTAAMCYPDYVTYDLDTELAEFFETMYGRTLTEEQIHALYQPEA